MSDVLSPCVTGGVGAGQARGTGTALLSDLSWAHCDNPCVALPTAVQ